MIISIIAAVDEDLGIGKDNRLPWHLSEDLKRFKRLTMGHHLIMGRRTFESIGRPLPGRTSLVLTRRKDLVVEGVIMVSSLDEALEIARSAAEEEVFVLGGGEVFRQALPLADRIYLTRVHARVDADTFFPELDPPAWDERLVSTHVADERNEHPHTFSVLERVRESNQ